MLLDMLLTPSTDGVGEMYQWLKNMLSTITAQQEKSSLQHWVEAYILTLTIPRLGGQRAAQGALEVGVVSSPLKCLVTTLGMLTAPPRGR
jgi:hypothetical protein